MIELHCGVGRKGNGIREDGEKRKEWRVEERKEGERIGRESMGWGERIMRVERAKSRISIEK